MIDLRSDTVTRPSAAMRAAMAAAEVGDDDYQDDPTVCRLEQRAAELMGKDAGLFVPSGIMSNLIAALAHCPEADRVVALNNSHIVWSLSGNQRVARWVRLTPVPSDERGLPEMDHLLTAIDSPCEPRVGLICFENTHNQAGGTALRPDETVGLIAMARDRGIPVHLDGARLFNAAIALGLTASELAADADTVTFCISKGLGAPVGSVLCGDARFIERARDLRKWLGGTMRQAGVIAVAGLVALEMGIDRLRVDHANAQWLARQLAAIPCIQVAPERVETNVLFVEHTGMDARSLYEALLARNILTNVLGGRIRLVTHLDVDRAQLAKAVEVIREIGSAVPVTR